jgi:hypothetical protein
MAQPQQQYPMPPARAFSPQETSSPTPATPSFVMPPSKRQRLSPNPSSQPGSPYVQSPYAPNAASPGASAPYSAGTSPHFPNVQLPPQGNYNTPYGNGHTTPALAIPQSQPNHHNSTSQTSLNFPNQTHNQNQNPNQVNHPGAYSAYTMPPQGVGAMGPPSKPADKPKEDGLDPTDVLGGTGIDLREEEQYTFQMYNSSFNSQRTGSQSGTISSGHSFTQFPPGDEASFYGAGPANAKAEAVNTKSQDEHSAKAAEKAWRDAAFNLAVSRQRELDNPFLHIGAVHQKMEKTAKENGLSLNIDSKGSMGTMKLPGDFPSNTVRTQTVTGTNGIIMSTQGNFVPYDSLLVDQLALMSIATKHRLRGLIEDAAKLSKGRQTGSHGFVPDEWADVAAPSSSASAAVEGGSRSGWESAVSPRTNPLKRMAPFYVLARKLILFKVLSPRGIEYRHLYLRMLRHPLSRQSTSTKSSTLCVKARYRSAKLRRLDSANEMLAQRGMLHHVKAPLYQGHRALLRPSSAKRCRLKRNRKRKLRRKSMRRLAMRLPMSQQRNFWALEVAYLARRRSIVG